MNTPANILGTARQASRTQMPPYVPESDDERTFLATYDLTKYPRPPELTVDVVLLTIRQGELCVLLIRRGDYPFKGQWALPGGFKNPGETLDDAAARELQEETSLSSPRGHLEQLGTYGDPGRDPRGDVVSVAYLGLLPDLERPVGGDDADEARFWRVADIVEEQLPLAFDHARILADGLERAASKLEYTALATAFCPTEFTMGELRQVYKAVWGRVQAAQNFRRKVLNTPGFLSESAGTRRGAAGGAPGQLYRDGGAALLYPPILRPQMRDHLGTSEPVRRFEPDLATGHLLTTDPTDPTDDSLDS